MPDDPSHQEMHGAPNLTDDSRSDDVRAADYIGMPYADAVKALWGETGIWDHAHYDAAGDLWINGLRLRDAAEEYGTPLEVVDTMIIERRAAEWKSLCRDVAAARGYSGNLRFLYAAKANMASEITHAAYRSGWHAETTATQDLSHLRWMKEHDILPDGLRVVCNGFKPAPEQFHLPRTADRQSEPHSDSLPLPSLRGALTRIHNLPYAAQIVDMAREGWDICPILDQGELEYFSRPGMPTMDVGLRLKFGRVHDDEAQSAHVSRFGHDRPALERAADSIAASGNLRLTTLHAMVGAATSIPVPTMVESLRYAGSVWADLHKKHPTLTELNMGGGVPPLAEAYDHAGLLTGLFDALKNVAESAGNQMPDVTFEFGSLVAAEAGAHVFSILQEKDNDTSGPPWMIIDGGLMAAIPDMLLIDKAFRILAVSGADRPARAVRLGDVSCDSDGRYPPESFGSKAIVLMPEGEPPMIAIFGIGAYQEILSGVRGAHHCGLLEALELIIEPGVDGKPRARLMPRQTPEEAASLLGYSEDAVAPLRETMQSDGHTT